jgi:membrane-associated phospholipid phosphatase
MKEGHNSISLKWKKFFQSKSSRTEFIITTLVLSLLLFFLTRFLLFVQSRPGVVLNDPVLNLFEPIDLTWAIFILIYTALIISIYMLLSSPVKLLTAMQVYSLMIVVRITAMYLTPLDPPLKMIPLQDPLVEIFGTGELLTKDLFFSGHTATLFILFLVAQNKVFKIILLTCTFLVALFVIVQHVHFAIDVFAAVFFTYGCYKTITAFRKKSSLQE